jgi:hypothetical protein
MLWELQRRFFEDRGVSAWDRGAVPHQVVTNPRIAETYARLLVALEEDCRHRHGDGEPLWVCELGAGNGRFGFNLLRALERVAREVGTPLDRFRYVMTDLAEINVAFWLAHPGLAPFVERGVLDVALVDATSVDRVELLISGEVLTAGSLQHPLGVVANYVFDSLPHEMIYLDADGAPQQGWVSLLVDRPPDELSPTTLLDHLHCRHEWRARGPEQDAGIHGLLSTYGAAATERWLLLPRAGLDCLAACRTLSRAGAVALVADRGSERLDAALRIDPPRFAPHSGALSHDVNFHALAHLCEARGGRALFPRWSSRYLRIGCLLDVDDPDRYELTRRAYHRELDHMNPDDHHVIARRLGARAASLTLDEVLAFLRMARFDDWVFAHLAPRLHELVVGAGDDPALVGRLAPMLDEVRANHYPAPGIPDPAAALDAIGAAIASSTNRRAHPSATPAGSGPAGAAAAGSPGRPGSSRAAPPLVLRPQGYS